jgi:hypothetical protein
LRNWDATPAEVAAPIHPHPNHSEAIAKHTCYIAGKPPHVYE